MRVAGRGRPGRLRSKIDRGAAPPRRPRRPAQRRRRSSCCRVRGRTAGVRREHGRGAVVGGRCARGPGDPSRQAARGCRRHGDRRDGRRGRLARHRPRLGGLPGDGAVHRRLAPRPQRARRRAFAEAVEAGRADCLGRLAGALAAELASALAADRRRRRPICRSSPSTPTSSSRRRSPRCSRACARSGRSRPPSWCGSAAATPRSARAPARAPRSLAAALSRDADAMISLSDVQVSGDVIQLRARLRAPAAPETGNNP